MTLLSMPKGVHYPGSPVETSPVEPHIPRILFARDAERILAMRRSRFLSSGEGHGAEEGPRWVAGRQADGDRAAAQPRREELCAPQGHGRQEVLKVLQSHGRSKSHEFNP